MNLLDEVPHGVVLGECVIEHGDADVRDEHEGFPRSRGNLWDSCIFFKGFKKLAQIKRKWKKQGHCSNSDASILGNESTNL
ncbi:hypothetical protein MUK42_34249 [Musa troglodytarum]|uniref:Uncharacterized protein n=1 Tax=Musa troglodytarum TaxID=320322 RepID=A0A9E7K7M4_9LILI|nr:hypothetical protein MUK42_34249 [Musa troglodytarum]